MSRQLVTFLVIVGLIGAGAYLVVFKPGALTRSAKGFKTAATPEDAAEQFRRAIKEREFDIAADYCTPAYAAELRKGAKAAKDLGVALDNLTYQMGERDLLRDEVKIALLSLDPFPTAIKVTAAPASGGTSQAVIEFEPVTFRGDASATAKWALKPEIFQVYSRGIGVVANKVTVPMKKDGEAWKLDIAADPGLAARVAYLNDKYKNYTNPMKLITQEVKNDPTTKEDATSRLKALLEQAAKE